MILPRESGKPATVGSEFGTTPHMKPEARLDGVGIWWITLGAVWTLLLVSGMTFLYKKRDTPTLRIRGLSLTFAGIILLHLYWITVQLGYSVGPLAPPVAEFWIMSIWYPFGIALFQAGNSQFLHVAKAQSRFARPPSQMSTRYDEKRLPRNASWLERLRRMDYSKRMFMFVTLGMLIQFLVVIIIYLISRKFHPEFGIPGTEVSGSTPMEIAMQQGRGWEWWPSLFWQFLWAWVVAPVILWQSRGIHDTHGWQLQTIACCVAGLPAAPMWLIALYVPEMAPVNAYFVPPQWIAVSIFVIEIFTIFVPCWQVRKHQNLRQETLECIANWESKKRLGNGSETATDNTTAPSLSSTSTKVGEAVGFEGWKKLPDLEANGGQINLSNMTDESVLTMAALEHVLDKNPEPLRQFSARRDFSGENIAFLTAVAEWKAALPPPFIRNRFDCNPDVARQQFTRALRIYAEFISPRDAEFPINIAWHDLRKLQGIFERAARSTVGIGTSTRGAADAATPFVEQPPPPPPPVPPSRDSELRILDGASTPKSPATPTTLPVEDVLLTPPTSSDLDYHGDVPAAFDASVFDAAQASIKYLVLTNTWPKYVRERRSLESVAGTAAAKSTARTKSTAGTSVTARSKRSIWRAFGFLKDVIN
ncbi:RGS domain-containing protein [Madurella fahalii]|uniref:RGS domain-containing protein n=1 Tax=Madurella fahalii TaxID=1157608 RepID=A0ABQ0FWF8_9PEZI